MSSCLGGLQIALQRVAQAEGIGIDTAFLTETLKATMVCLLREFTRVSGATCEQEMCADAQGAADVKVTKKPKRSEDSKGAAHMSISVSHRFPQQGKLFSVRSAA